MTSDGITDEDWGPVHVLALEIANADSDGDRKGHASQLFQLLDALEHKYGPLPSILATRGDYADDISEANAFLERAYQLAEQRRDATNQLYPASSLALNYLTVLRDREEGKKWLSTMAARLRTCGDETDIEEYEELTRALEDLT